MRKVLLFAATTLVFAAMTLTTNAQKEARKRIDLKATEVTSRGANPNIKGDRPTTDAPAASRGNGSYTCWVYLHNYTAYSIDIYVDGYWEGTLGAWADSYVSTGSGYTTMYGLSVGKTREWNFSGADCYGSYDYYFY